MRNSGNNEVSFRPPDIEAVDESRPLLSETPPVNNVNEPNDRYWTVYWTFYLLGMSTLLPWNFFISANSFWDYKFRHINATSSYGDDSKSILQVEFTSYLSICSNVPNAAFVIINAIYGQKICLNKRLIVSLSVIISLFCVISVLSMVDSDSWQRQFMGLVLLIVFFVNVCTAIFQGGSFGVAGKFPPAYMGGVMSGQAMGGIFPALVEVLVVAVRIQPKHIGLASFLVATAVLILALISIFSVKKNPYFLHFSHRSTEGASSSGGNGSGNSFVVFWKIWIYCLSVFLVFATTLSVFPALTVLIESKRYPDSRYFTPLTSFVLFNVGDYIGRVFMSAFKLDKIFGPKFILTSSLIRILFIPLFMLCNAQPGHRTYLPIWIHSDVLYVILMVVFSLTNGFLGNLCMVKAPKVLENADDQETAAMVMVACLVLGTAIGSFVSYPVVLLL